MKKLLVIILFISNAAIAQKIAQSGTVYKQHPNIETIRKLASLYEKGDADDMAKFYDAKVQFRGMGRYMPGPRSKTKSLEEAKAGWKDVINNWQNIKMTETREPEGVQSTGEPFTVQSWWVLSVVNKKTKKQAQIDMVLFDSFNKEGKIISQLQYYDPTPLMAAAK
jgi:hypothetical protein